MELTNNGTKLTEAMISEIEKELEIKYPEDYKDFMLKNNGGEPVGNWAFDFYEFNVPEKTGSIVSYFEKIYLNDTEENDDQKVGYLALVDSGQIPKEYLPIADDPFGNIIFICVGGKQFGNIFLGMLNWKTQRQVISL